MTPSNPHEWEVESDLRTLIEAEKIKADPDRVARAKRLAAVKAGEMAYVAGKRDEDVDEMLSLGYRRIK